MSSIYKKEFIHKNILLAIVLTGFVASTYGFGVYLFANIVVDMKKDLGFDYTLVGLITGAAQAGFLIFSAVTSYISKFISGWKISLFSTMITTICLILLGISDNILFSSFILIVLGGCSASVYIPLAEIVSKSFAEDKRARVMGLISSGTSYGVFINGILVSFFLATLGWRYIWLIAGGISLLLCLVGYFLLRNSSSSDEHSTRNNEIYTVNSDSKWITSSLVILWGIAFLNGATLLPFQTYLAPFMRDELGFSISLAGSVWSTIGLVGMASGFVVGWFADKIGVKNALALCFLSATTSAFLVFFTKDEFYFFVIAFLFSVAFYPIFGLVPSLIGRLVSINKITLAFGVANILIGIGGVIGNFLGGLFHDKYQTFTGLYLIIAILIFIQFCLTLLIHDKIKYSNR